MREALLDCGREAAALPLAHGPHESRAESGSFAAAVQSAFGTGIFIIESTEVTER